MTVPPPTLDSSLYSIAENEAAFFKQQIGITDDEELKKHIIDIQTRAYKVFPYPCIRHFRFKILKISRLHAYPAFLRLRKERPNPIYLEMGCCFGNDPRKAIADGYPIRSVIASDLRKEFWSLGHELFNSTPESFPVPFVEGDVFDSELISPSKPVYGSPVGKAPDLTTLTSLSPLQGHVSAIHASSFFHLFDEEKQLQIAKALASLLSPLPGSMIFGSHVGGDVKGKRVNHRGDEAFAHSPESWTALWDGPIFGKGTVRVEAILNDRIADPGRSSKILDWSVTRL